jgi:hypothetical protein
VKRPNAHELAMFLMHGDAVRVWFRGSHSRNDTERTHLSTGTIPRASSGRAGALATSTETRLSFRRRRHSQGSTGNPNGESQAQCRVLTRRTRSSRSG